VRRFIRSIGAEGLIIADKVYQRGRIIEQCRFNYKELYHVPSINELAGSKDFLKPKNVTN
jgi:hypothetical protein